MAGGALAGDGSQPDRPGLPHTAGAHECHDIQIVTRLSGTSSRAGWSGSCVKVASVLGGRDSVCDP